MISWRLKHQFCTQRCVIFICVFRIVFKNYTKIIDYNPQSAQQQNCTWKVFSVELFPIRNNANNVKSCQIIPNNAKSCQIAPRSFAITDVQKDKFRLQFSIPWSSICYPWVWLSTSTNPIQHDPQPHVHRKPLPPSARIHWKDLRRCADILLLCTAPRVLQFCPRAQAKRESIRAKMDPNSIGKLSMVVATRQDMSTRKWTVYNLTFGSIRLRNIEWKQ